MGRQPNGLTKRETETQPNTKKTSKSYHPIYPNISIIRSVSLFLTHHYTPPHLSSVKSQIGSDPINWSVRQPETSKPSQELTK